jgi:putative nucleotidyltransferase with HDIG domain
MRSPKYKRRAFWAAELLLLAATIVASLELARVGEWHPLSLVALLLALAFMGQWFSVDIRGGQLNPFLIAIVLAMGLLGPLPAAACGIAPMILKSTVRRLSPAAWLNNLSTYAAVPFAGGLIVRTVVHAVPSLMSHGLAQSSTFGLILFAVFLLATALSFILFALDGSTKDEVSVRREMRELLPLLPGELAAGALATILALAYRGVGTSALLAGIVVLLIFQRLMVALLRSEDRAEQLFARSRQLVGLQLGVLRTLVRALGMRDQRTARHAAAVAFYAKTLAAELGSDTDQQDMIHTAGLLHDIGKFTWPDRILNADVVQAEDLATVQRHPQEGAILVGTLDGYGEVADAILYHHERIDGRGYPAGLIGNEIPLGSRILAICSNYDAMTASDSYRSPMAPEEAMTELRSAARNGQLDPELVEVFIAVLEREGTTFAQESDFETELEFERRVRKLAEPGSGEPGSQTTHAAGARSRDWLSSGPILGRRALNKD